jgi:hypothetical protein
VARKKHVGKEGKVARRRKCNMARRKKSLTGIGLGFFDKDCNGYKLGK